MKIRIFYFALVAVLLAGASAAWAQSDFYVIGGGGQPVGTKITSLPYTINNSGFYFLGSDLGFNPTSGDAITINHNDVTLDLMGHILFGPGSGTNTTGILMSGRYNVEVRNGSVAGFAYGIYEDSGAGSNQRYINIRTAGNKEGIYLNGSNTMVKNCTSSANNDFGIFSRGAGALIADKVVCNNYNGIRMYGPGSLLGNTVCNNLLGGIDIGNGGADSILVDRNTVFGSIVNFVVDYGTTGVVITTSNAGLP